MWSPPKASTPTSSPWRMRKAASSNSTALRRSKSASHWPLCQRPPTTSMPAIISLSVNSPVFLLRTFLRAKYYDFLTFLFQKKTDISSEAIVVSDSNEKVSVPTGTNVLLENAPNEVKVHLNTGKRTDPFTLAASLDQTLLFIFLRTLLVVSQLDTWSSLWTDSHTMWQSAQSTRNCSVTLASWPAQSTMTHKSSSWDAQSTVNRNGNENSRQLFACFIVVFTPESINWTGLSLSQQVLIINDFDWITSKPYIFLLHSIVWVIFSFIMRVLETDCI